MKTGKLEADAQLQAGLRIKNLFFLADSVFVRMPARDCDKKERCCRPEKVCNNTTPESEAAFVQGLWSLSIFAEGIDCGRPGMAAWLTHWMEPDDVAHANNWN